MDSLLFATLFVERDPLSWVDVPAGVVQWVQSVGGFACLGLLLWLVFGWMRTSAVEKSRIPAWKKILFSALAGSGLILFGIAIALRFVNAGANIDPQNIKLMDNLQVLASALCLGAILLPFICNLPRFSLRRIFGLAKLSFQEALRRKVVYAFAALLLIFLFASWFIPYKPEDQVRSYVQVVYWAMSPLFLLTSSLLAAFSIPSDIKSQTIHTIVTKPVERFEIIVGRFLGFTALMTVILFVMTATSLLYVIRGIDPAAASESLKARVPLYGELSF